MATIIHSQRIGLAPLRASITLFQEVTDLFSAQLIFDLPTLNPPNGSWPTDSTPNSEQAMDDATLVYNQLLQFATSAHQILAGFQEFKTRQ